MLMEKTPFFSHRQSFFAKHSIASFRMCFLGRRNGIARNSSSFIRFCAIPRTMSFM